MSRVGRQESGGWPTPRCSPSTAVTTASPCHARQRQGQRAVVGAARRAAGDRRGVGRRSARRASSSRAASGSSPPAPTSPSSAGPTRRRRSPPGSTTRSTPIAAFPRFVIAAVSGYALGGGCELALACDYRIVSDKAVFGQPEILLGIIPGGGGTQRLARAVGASRAKELCLTGRQVRAEEALRIGLADEVVPHDELHERALALAAEVAGGALVAQALTKQAIDDGLSVVARRRAGDRAGQRSWRSSTPTTHASASPASSNTARARPTSPAADRWPPAQPSPRSTSDASLSSDMLQPSSLSSADTPGGRSSWRPTSSVPPSVACSV